MREVWEGMKTITGCSSRTGAPIEGVVGRESQIKQFFFFYQEFDMLIPFTLVNTAAPTPHNPSNALKRTTSLLLTPPTITTEQAVPKQSCMSRGLPELKACAWDTLQHRRPQAYHALKLLFPYWEKVGVEDAIIRDKLAEMGVASHLVACITNYLTGRPQYVWLEFGHRSAAGDCVQPS